MLPSMLHGMLLRMSPRTPLIMSLGVSLIKKFLCVLYNFSMRIIPQFNEYSKYYIEKYLDKSNKFSARTMKRCLFGGLVLLPTGDVRVV